MKIWDNYARTQEQGLQFWLTWMLSHRKLRYCIWRTEFLYSSNYLTGPSLSSHSFYFATVEEVRICEGCNIGTGTIYFGKRSSHSNIQGDAQSILVHYTIHINLNITFSEQIMTRLKVTFNREKIQFWLFSSCFL